MAFADRDVLPDIVKPLHYDIHLFDLELGGSFSYQGTVSVTVDVKKPTKEIVLNAFQLKLHHASISTGSSGAVQASNISYNEKSQRATLELSQEIPISSKSILSINFAGTMNNIMAGFYRSRYEPAVTPAASVPKVEDSHYMFSTQFESSDARRAFPCFDEPNLKATFDFSIEIPSDLTALSNMPEKASTEGKNGRKVVSFDRSPIMSTYLLVWAFGDFEYVEELTRRKYNGRAIPVRVYTTRGLKSQGLYALENAHQLVDYYSKIFKIDYPLPKIDLLSVHEFTHGAMENWGLITYRTTDLLFDEQRSDAKNKNRIAYVVAHELAHQWFGNLVTMDWWNELWLNEGFATWVGYLALEYLYPDWSIWAQFVSGDLQMAFQLDSLRASHPIEVPVRDALEVDQVFDAISYRKGSSVIRMLSAHLGLETFLAGVSNYLEAHAYGNATTNDLWDALSKASGQDIPSFMNPWIRKIGFPVLTVVEEPGQIAVRQSRFLSSGDVKAEEDETLWWIPLGLKTDQQASHATGKALTIKEETLRGIDETFYKLNADQIGVYRTNYPPDRLIKLGAARDRLTVEDRIGIVGDAAALAIAGSATTAGLLALCAEFKSESNCHVWSQILNSLGKVQSIFADNQTVSQGLDSFVVQLITPAMEKIGWEFSPDEDFLTGRLRTLLIDAGGSSGHHGIISEAKRRFAAFSAGDQNIIPPNLRLVIFKIAVGRGARQEYETVKREYLTTKAVEGKKTCLHAMGRVQTADLVEEFMEFQFSDKVAIQDTHFGSMTLASNAKAQSILWQWIKDHWQTVHEKLAGNSVIIYRYINGLDTFASYDKEKDIAMFFKDKDTKGYDKAVMEVLGAVGGNAKYKERDEDLVLEWLQAHGYV